MELVFNNGGNDTFFKSWVDNCNPFNMPWVVRIEASNEIFPRRLSLNQPEGRSQATVGVS